MVFPLAAIALTSPLLWRRGTVYRAATLAQTGLYGLGALGLALADKPLGRRKLLALPAFFCFVNAAALRAAWNLARGRRIDRWEPRRAGSRPAGRRDPGGEPKMNVASQAESLESVWHGVKRLRGDPTVPPHASIVVPVNAQADLENVLDIVGDVSRYEGSRTFEVVLVINNYPADAPPRELATYAAAGMRTVGIPAAWQKGEVVSFTARIAPAPCGRIQSLVQFDAECRLPNPTVAARLVREAD